MKPILSETTLTSLRELGDDDPEFLPSLIRSYLSTFEKDLLAVEAAFSGQDLPVLMKKSHSWKGSSLQIGAARLSEALEEIETAARTGNHTALTEPTLKHLREEAASTETALKALLK